MTKRTVKSYFYEGIVIVASILIAFGLDASWDNYQESRIEQRVLGELREEVLSAKKYIESSITELESVIEASEQLAGYIGSDTPPLSREVSEDLVKRILDFNTLEVPTSVLDSVIASGQIRLLSNQSLRDALAAWPTFILDVRENHEWHRVETDEYLVPYLARHVAIRNTTDTWPAGFPRASLEYDAIAMQRDPEFEGRFTWRISRQAATLSESRVLLERTENLLVLIEAELD